MIQVLHLHFAKAMQTTRELFFRYEHLPYFARLLLNIDEGTASWIPKSKAHLRGSKQPHAIFVMIVSLHSVISQIQRHVARCCFCEDKIER